MKPNSFLFCSAVLFLKTITATKHHRLPANFANSADLDNDYSTSLPSTSVKPRMQQPKAPPEPADVVAPPKPKDGVVPPKLKDVVAFHKTPGASVEDIILSGINANDEIETRILNTIMKFASNYSNFKAIRFTTKDYLFEKKTIEMELDEGDAVSFNNFKVNSSYEDDHSKPKFATQVQCNSDGNTTVQVVLPNIDISFNATVTSSFPKLSYHGSIGILLENSMLIGAVETESREMTSNQVHSARILNEKSKFVILIDPTYNTPVYDRLQEILSEIKHSLQEFFLVQLNLQMQNFTNVTTSCSKGPSDSNKIYVITDTKSDSWNNISLTVGPAIIEGLTHFNKVDFHVWDTSFQNFNNLLCLSELSLQTTVDSLTGKMMWNYSYPQNSSEKSTSAFNVDYFEIRCDMKPVTDDSQAGLNLIETTVETKLGEIRIVMSELNRSEDERNFVNVILSDHLGILINRWLQKFVVEKILQRIQYFNCLTGKPRN